MSKKNRVLTKEEIEMLLWGVDDMMKDINKRMNEAFAISPETKREYDKLILLCIKRKYELLEMQREMEKKDE